MDEDGSQKQQHKWLRSVTLFRIFYIVFLSISIALLVTNRNNILGWVIILAVFGALFTLRKYLAAMRSWIQVVVWIFTAALLTVPFCATISPSLPSMQARVMKCLIFAENTRQNDQSYQWSFFTQLIRRSMELIAHDDDFRKGIHVEEAEAYGVPGEWVYTKDAPQNRAILYLHGGGFVTGSPRASRAISVGIARHSGVRVFAVDYRLAPHHPFPAGLEDCITAYRWLLSHGIPAKGIVIAGDSAGGNLALAVGLALKMKGEVLPAAFIAISPCTDLAATGESFKSKAKDDPVLDPAMLGYIVRRYLPKDSKREVYVKNPLVSPLYGVFDGYSPVLIEVGTEEILLDDSRRVAAKLRAYGVRVTLKEWNGLWHVFPYVTYLPESKRCFEEMGDFVRTRLGMSSDTKSHSKYR